MSVRTSASKMLLPVLSVLLLGCATTASDIHSWGGSGDFDRIRQELTAHPAQDIRIAAAMQFGSANSGLVIPDLVGLSLDRSAEVRLAAVQSLGAYAGRQVYGAILQRCADDNREVSEAAEQILRTWGSESVEVMFEALNDKNYRVRAAAVQVLSRMTDARVGHHLVDRARLDDNSLVRREAVRGLGNLRFEPARKLLFSLKNTDPSSEVALEAEQALAKIGGQVSRVKVVVAPIAALWKNKDAGVLRERISQALVSAKVCDVLMPETEPAGTDRKAMCDWARVAGADQIVLVEMTRDKNRVNIRLSRLSVEESRLLQQEEATGYEGNMDRPLRDMVDLFIRRFQ